MDVTAIDPVWWVVIGVVLVAIVLGLVMWASRRKSKRSQRLRQSFRSEYDRATGSGKRKEAEQDLERRLARRREVALKDLPDTDADDLQSHIDVLGREFVDGPQGAARGMTQLVGRIAVARGYVATEQGVLDLVSVDHPEQVASLRRGLDELDRTKGAELTEASRRVFLDARVLAERLLAEGTVGQLSATDTASEAPVPGAGPTTGDPELTEEIPAEGERSSTRVSPPAPGSDER